MAIENENKLDEVIKAFADCGFIDDRLPFVSIQDFGTDLLVGGLDVDEVGGGAEGHRVFAPFLFVEIEEGVG